MVVYRVLIGCFRGFTVGYALRGGHEYDGDDGGRSPPSRCYVRDGHGGILADDAVALDPFV